MTSPAPVTNSSGQVAANCTFFLLSMFLQLTVIKMFHEGISLSRRKICHRHSLRLPTLASISPLRALSTGAPTGSNGGEGKGSGGNDRTVIFRGRRKRHKLDRFFDLYSFDQLLSSTPRIPSDLPSKDQYFSIPLPGSSSQKVPINPSSTRPNSTGAGANIMNVIMKSVSS